MNALEHFVWNSNLIASVFQNCTWIRLSKVNFRIFPKWCMCCDVAGTLKQHQTDQQQAGCSFSVEITFPCTKACCTLSACSHSVQEAQLGKRWNCTYGGIKSSDSQWAFFVSQPSPYCETLQETSTGPCIHSHCDTYDVKNAQIWVIFCSCS